MEDEAVPPYQVPRSFQLVEAMQPLLEEASDPKKELWLLRLPGAHDLDLAELANSSWRLNLQAANGELGDLVCNGIKYSFQRHSIQGSTKFAYIPGQNNIQVRPVPVEVSIVKSVDRTIEQPAAAAAEEADPNPAQDPATVSDQEKSGITRESSKRSKSSSKQKRSMSEGGESSKGKRNS